MVYSLPGPWATLGKTQTKISPLESLWSCWNFFVKIPVFVSTFSIHSWKQLLWTPLADFTWKWVLDLRKEELVLEPMWKCLVQMHMGQRRVEERLVQTFRSIAIFKGRPETEWKVIRGVLFFQGEHVPRGSSVEVFCMTMCCSVWAGQPHCSSTCWKMQRLKPTLVQGQQAAVDKFIIAPRHWL